METSCEGSSCSNRAEWLGKGTEKRQKSLHALPSNTVRLIGSSQVITSVSNVVKELLENSLDANASNVEIKLENYGLDRIEVRDNGSGIPSSEAGCVAKRYHTSKISSFEDLELLDTYGFRGEALGSLCTVSDLSITTKTKADDFGTTFTFSHQGEITSEKPSHFGQGTTVVAVNLFKNLPVRKQFYNTSKKKKEELKKVEDLVMSYGVIRPDIRISLRHNKDLVWQKFSVMDHRTVLLNILGTSVFSQLEKKVVAHDNPKMSIEAFIPKVKSKVDLTSRSSSDRNLVFVNKRPVILKDVDKAVRHYYMNHQQCETTRYPIYFMSVILPSCDVDVNVEPDKTKVMLQHQAYLMRLVTDLLENHYGALVPVTRVRNVEKNEENNNEGSDLEDSDPALLGQRSLAVEDQPSGDKIREDDGKMSVRNGLRNDDSSITYHGKASADGEQNTELMGKRTDQSPSDLGNGEIMTELSQDDPFGSFDLEVLTPVKQISADIEQGDGQSSVSEPRIEQVICLASGPRDEESCILNVNSSEMESDRKSLHGKGDNYVKGDNLGSNADGSISAVNTVDLMTQKQEAYQELMEDMKMDDILCTFNDDMGDESRMSARENVTGGASSEESNQPLDISTDSARQTSDDQWSKGQALSSEGKAIQGPVMLLPPALSTGASGAVNSNGKRPSSDSPTHDAPGEPKAKKVSLGQTTMFDLMNSQPVKRPQTAFIHFSKEVRPKVVEENPEAGFQQIAKITGEKWKNLTNDEKQKYEQLCTKDVERYREQMRSAKELVNRGIKKPDKVCKKSSGLSIKDCLINMSPKTPQRPRTPLPRISPPSKRHSVKTTTAPFSFDKLKQMCSRGLRQSQSQADAPLHLIGYLKSHGCWVCCHGNKMEILNPYGIEETVLYHRLMENHIMTTDKLDVPQDLRRSVMNRSGSLYDVWSTLVSLTTNSELIGGYHHIKDQRLTANGFDVRWFKDDNSSELTLQLVGVAQDFLRYGVAELREVLEMISVTGAQTISHCRPMKVIEYLKSEAVRVVRKSPDKTRREDMEDLLEQMTSQLPRGCLTCLHDKTFCHEIYDLADIPFSQTQPGNSTQR